MQRGPALLTSEQPERRSVHLEDVSGEHLLDQLRFGALGIVDNLRKEQRESRRVDVAHDARFEQSAVFSAANAIERGVLKVQIADNRDHSKAPIKRAEQRLRRRGKPRQIRFVRTSKIRRLLPELGARRSDSKRRPGGGYVRRTPAEALGRCTARAPRARPRARSSNRAQPMAHPSRSGLERRPCPKECWLGSSSRGRSSCRRSRAARRHQWHPRWAR